MVILGRLVILEIIVVVVGIKIIVHCSCMLSGDSMRPPLDPKPQYPCELLSC